jgi:CO dehydrogenase/acetyl-CoA synthase gamma subunit (corrinoid Fe-S protein)
MNYTVEPGLYSIGDPDESSPVLVTANYRLTCDQLRKAMEKSSVWVLVINTKGINVWCAAGKGTFGTSELINRIKCTGLESIVKHKSLILPQLGAAGRRTGPGRGERRVTRTPPSEATVS